MANALTAVRLALALPVAVALARPELLAPGVVAFVIGLAIVTDFLDGPVARTHVLDAGDEFDKLPEADRAPIAVPASPPADRPCERDRPSDGGLDGTADD